MGELTCLSRQGRERFFVELIGVSIPRDRRHGPSSSSSGPNQSFQTASENSGGTQRGFWADPPRLSPRPNWLEIWCQIGVKDRRFGRFCRLSRLVTTYPSTTYVFRLSMAWKRSSVRSRSGPPKHSLIGSSNASVDRLFLLYSYPGFLRPTKSDLTFFRPLMCQFFSD